MKNLQKIAPQGLSSKLAEVDDEFKDFLGALNFEREVGHDKLKTFSPLDAVADFEQRGIHAVREVSRDEMLANDQSMNKLLANMLKECRPGALSDEDLNLITGINGREVQAGL